MAVKNINASTARKHELQSLQLIVKNAGEYALLLLSPDRSITYWNLGAQRLWGYREEEIIGRHVEILFQPEDVRHGVPAKEFDKAEELGWADDERWHIRKDKSLFWASGVVTCLKDDSGQIVGYSKMVRDHTLRKQTEDKVKSANAEMSRFTSILSHDLMEPLRTASNYLSLLDRHYRGKVDARHDQFLSLALSNVARLRHLTDDLLSYARLEQDPVFERIELAAVFDMAVSQLKLAIDEAQAIVSRAVLPIVHGSSTQLVRLLQNLISNGLKYRKANERPLIFMDAAAEGTDWAFCIRDNGIGIGASYREKVFEAFRRLHSADIYPGSGLGLYICRKIVERHGGRIWIESNEGEGTAVWFTLPQRADDQQLHSGEGSPVASP